MPRAKGRSPGHSSAPQSGGKFTSSKAQFFPSLSPPEAAETGAQTVGHSPQGCRPFRVSPLSELLLFAAVCPAPLPAESDPTIAHRLDDVNRQIGTFV